MTEGGRWPQSHGSHSWSWRGAVWSNSKPGDKTLGTGVGGWSEWRRLTTINNCPRRSSQKNWGSKVRQITCGGAVTPGSRKTLGMEEVDSLFLLWDVRISGEWTASMWEGCGATVSWQCYCSVEFLLHSASPSLLSRPASSHKDQFTWMQDGCPLIPVALTATLLTWLCTARQSTPSHLWAS